MSQCTKFHDNVTCSSPRKSKLTKCDGRTNGRTDEWTEKLYTPQLSLAGYKKNLFPAAVTKCSG